MASCTSNDKSSLRRSSSRRAQRFYTTTPTPRGPAYGSRALIRPKTRTTPYKTSDSLSPAEGRLSLTNAGSARKLVRDENMLRLLKLQRRVHKNHINQCVLFIVEREHKHGVESSHALR